MQYRKVFILLLLILLFILLVGSTQIKIYHLNSYQPDEQYLKQLEESDFDLAHIEEIEACNDYGCYDGTVTYYKSTETDNDNHALFVILTLNVKPKNDYSPTDSYVQM